MQEGSEFEGQADERLSGLLGGGRMGLPVVLALQGYSI